MRRKDREIKDPETIKRILEKAEVCRIGMYDGEYPYVLPVNFVYHPSQDAIYIHSALTGKKAEILSEYSKVCIEIDEPGGVIDNGKPCDAEFTYTSLIGRGLAELCTDESEIRIALAMITEKYLRRSARIGKKELESVAVYKINIAKISGKRHRRS